MSLVAYDDSSSEDEKEEDKVPSPAVEAPPQLPLRPNQNSMLPPSNQSSSTVPAPSLLPSLDELPDALFLLDSPPENRKRESNGNSIQPRQSKIPRGGQSTLVHARNVHGRGPTTTMLVPPQLSGRSNVVTEDTDKLFVNRRRSSTG